MPTATIVQPMIVTYEAAVRYLRTHGVRSRAAVLRYFAEADRANAGAEYDRQVAPPAPEAR